MTDENEGRKDLLGDPWTPPRDPRGRKRHRRAAEVAEKVAVLVATGSTVGEIAQRIGLSEPTLRKYYFRELEQGSELARQVLIETMWGKALSGNVGAARFIKDELSKGDNAAFLRKSDKGSTSETPPARLGKKEAAAAAAQTAGQGSQWGDDLAFPTHKH